MYTLKYNETTRGINLEEREEISQRDNATDAKQQNKTETGKKTKEAVMSVLSSREKGKKREGEFDGVKTRNVKMRRNVQMKQLHEKVGVDGIVSSREAVAE